MNIRIVLLCAIISLLMSCSSPNKYTPERVNLIKANNWMLVNGKREGVIQTESGLQYKILKASEGCKPNPDYKVTVHYDMFSEHARKIVDSSYSRQVPAKFKLSQLIKGWREGVPLMNVGETWEFYIPPNLGYGTRGTDGVAPNTVLISKIDLIAAGRCKR
jgi:FKBP-type peptidyl-prolyl cis-trans isomerase FklB